MEVEEGIRSEENFTAKDTKKKKKVEKVNNQGQSYLIASCDPESKSGNCLCVSGLVNVAGANQITGMLPGLV